MKNKELVTREDDSEQNSSVLRNWRSKPLTMPLLILTLIFVLLPCTHWHFYRAEMKEDIAAFSTIVQITSGLFALFFLALCGVYWWSRKRCYEVFCDWFYDESRGWSYAGFTVAVVLAFSAFLIQNALLLDSVEEAGQLFTIASLKIPYTNAMFIAWQIIINMLIFMFYFKIDRSLEITNSVNNKTAFPLFAFAFAPLLTAVAKAFEPIDDLMLIGALLAATVSTFFIWTHISRTHAPQNTEEKGPRKSLRRYISRQRDTYRQLRCWCGHQQQQYWYIYLQPRCWCWAWDKKSPPRQERNVGMFT